MDKSFSQLFARLLLHFKSGGIFLRKRSEHAWERETFRVQVRAGTGKVSTANSKPTRDWQTADESSKQTQSMPLG